MGKRKRTGLLRWFRNQKLWKKILYAFIISAIVPLAVVQGFMAHMNSTSMKAKLDELMINELVQMAERVNLTLNVYTSLLYQIYIDNQIIENINCLLDDTRTEQEAARREIYDRIRQYDISAEGIECISIILTDGQQLTYDFNSASTVQSIWEGYTDLRKILPYTEAQDTAGAVITPTMQYTRYGKEERLFHLSKRMYDYRNLEKGSIATIVMSIDEQVLNRICTTDYGRDPEQKYSVNFIADRNGHVLSYPDFHYSGDVLSGPDFRIEAFVRDTGRLEGKKIAFNQYEDKNLGWIFYNVYDKDYMWKELEDTQKFTLAVDLFIMMFAVLMIAYTIQLIERSTRSVMQGIWEVQKGNLDVKVYVDAEDEFGEIAESFNTMTGKLQELLLEVTDATRKQKEAEIHALEAQINPHFLYNTLDSINWMAIDKGEYEISKMLRDLGVILRYSVSRSNQIVRVSEAADWLEKYVSLQQLRFNYAFSFALHVEEQVKSVGIYKLLLQPFIENSILHGFKEITGGGILRVDIVLSENQKMLHVIIEDNGKGMEPEEVKRYNDRERILGGAGSGIGLTNAFCRMHMYYGEKAEWNVSSIQNVGTVITIKLPVSDAGDRSVPELQEENAGIG